MFENSIKDALTKGRGGKGSVIVFASHNQGYSTVRYPGGLFPEIICVGNMMQSGGRWPMSNYGLPLDVVAPGTNIWSTAGIAGTNQTVPGYTTGTSFAAPHVSGVAALMLSVNDCLSGEDVGTIIEKTAQKVNTSTYSYTNWSHRANGKWNNEMGYGLLDAHAAVKLADSMKKSTKDLYIKDRPYDMV